MNGNVTKEGIEKDLQWMKRVGIGGLQNFDGAFDTPQVVEHRLIYMTPAWQDAFRYAMQRAEGLGLEFAIASSPGWSETGGPWVRPEDGMKKLVWGETHISGGTAFVGTLTAPPSVSGPFQHFPATDLQSGERIDVPSLYRDVAVLAYRTPTGLLADPQPVSITTSLPSIDASGLLRTESTQPIVLPASSADPAWILYDYGAPQCFRAACLSRPKNLSLTSFTWVIEASNDGESFFRLAEAEFPDEHSFRQTTIALPPIRARYVRLIMSPVPRKTWFQFAANAPGAEEVRLTDPGRDVALYTFRLYRGARVHRFEEKAGFAIVPDYYTLESRTHDTDEAVDPQDVIDLTRSMSDAGTLSWTPPPGDWTILRLGYSLTGKTNHPASPEATGLEVDKLDPQAVRRYLDTYLGNFEKVVGQNWMGRQGIRAFLTDSIESQGQNWTPRLIEEFEVRRGYNPTNWLPTLTGVIVADAMRTDRFLWDFRQTLIELMSEAHYAQIASGVHARGMTYYSESLEGYPTLAMGDDLDMRAAADIPMAAVWTSYAPQQRDGIQNHIIDMQGAASVAHVYGKPLVAVEALTSGYEPWAFCPSSLKPVIDLAFALGINRAVIHTSVHQPVEKKPGMSLGPFGQHFTRHETWAEMAAPWITYLSRCSYLLQQGRHVADVAWFYGEGGSLAGLYEERAPADLPRGYGFDFVSPHMLIHDLSAKDERLVSSGGAFYRLLYLGGSSARMTLHVLRKVKSLADQGVPIAGPRPVGSPSLADAGQEKEKEYHELVATLWGTGRILDGLDPNAILERLGLEQDFAYVKPSPDSSVMFLHRSTPEGEIYFVTNRNARAECIEASFRLDGRRPELWHPDTGEREAVAWQATEGRTLVYLNLTANQSVFVVFFEPTQEASKNCPTRLESPLMQLDGDWELSFEADRGAPPGVHSTTLTCWTQSSDPGIRYFSGTGTYRKTFFMDPFDMETGERVILDLGEVHELAEVTLNRKLIGTPWHAPYRVDVTESLTAGPNTIEIRVANLWVNRLIGDKQPGATPVAFTVTTTYKATAPLRPSGLMGPVVLLKCKRVDVAH